MSEDLMYKTDDGSALRIWSDTAKNNFRSESMGRPVFDQVIFVEVIAPGSKGSVPIFEVEREFDSESGMKPKRSMQYVTYQKQIEAFKANEGDRGDMHGTPIGEWPPITKTMAASLRESRVFTVEALASLPDANLHVVGPEARQWREKAKAFIAASEGGAAALALAAENERLREDLAAQQEALQELAAQVSALQLQAAANGPQNAPQTAALQQQAAPVAQAVPKGAKLTADII